MGTEKNPGTSLKVGWLAPTGAAVCGLQRCTNLPAAVLEGRGRFLHPSLLSIVALLTTILDSTGISAAFWRRISPVEHDGLSL
jgi:hypothetical protein